jgi:hypothetical protein
MDENDVALALTRRPDGSYAPVLTGDTLKDDIMWVGDVIYPHDDEVSVHFEGVTKKLPVIRSQAPTEEEPAYYIAHSVAWRFIHEVRDAAKKGAGKTD